MCSDEEYVFRYQLLVQDCTHSLWNCDKFLLILRWICYKKERILLWIYNKNHCLCTLKQQIMFYQSIQHI